MPRKTSLVVGSTGFVGSKIVKSLSEVEGETIALTRRSINPDSRPVAIPENLAVLDGGGRMQNPCGRHPFGEHGRKRQPP